MTDTDAVRCVHELLAGQCADCKAPPAGVLKVGYVTAGGSVFHNDATCEWLLEGQRHAARLGLRLHEPERTAWPAAQARGLGSCRHCCTPRWLKTHRADSAEPAPAPAGSRPCFVRVDGRWQPGHLIWKGKGDAGWWAEVTYRTGGRAIVTTATAPHLRPR